MGLETDLLVGAGLVKLLIMGGGSLDRFGPVHCVNRGREASRDFAHDYSSLSITFRYLAGALGLSFIPIKCLLASEILERLEAGSASGDVRRMKCPFTGEEYLLMRALNPDVSFVHVQIADRDGNCQIDGPIWSNEESVKAGNRVVVVTEELVPTEVIRRSPERTIIPGHRVEAVIHQPFGGHPTGVFGCYDYDAEHLKLYVSHSKKAETFPEYLKTYVLEYQGPLGILGKGGRLEADERAESRADSRLLTAWGVTHPSRRRTMPEVMPDVQVRATEIMAAAGARELHDGEVVVVGIGLPQVAAVLAKRTHAPHADHASRNRRDQHATPMDTPVGLADSRIFYRATCWSGFLDVMGMNLHRGVVDVGFLGALEIDRYGNINTTLLKEESGKVRYFNGSAGGNDVASLAKRVIDDHAARKAQAAECGRSPDESRLRGRQEPPGAGLTRRRSTPRHYRQGRPRIRFRRLIRRRCSPCIRGSIWRMSWPIRDFPCRSPSRFPLTPLPTAGGVAPVAGRDRSESCLHNVSALPRAHARSAIESEERS